MNIFKDLTSDQIAAQHQLLIEMLINVLFTIGGDNRKAAATSVEKMIALCRESGQDTTILEFTLSGLKQQPVPEGRH